MTELRLSKKIVVGSAVVVVVAGMLAWFGSYAANHRPRPSYDWINALTLCQHFVTDELKSPGSAKFPTPDNYDVSGPLDNRFVVRSYVDAQNVFGGSVRTNYICTVKWIGEDRWQLQDLEFRGR